MRKSPAVPCRAVGGAGFTINQTLLVSPDCNPYYNFSMESIWPSYAASVMRQYLLPLAGDAEALVIAVINAHELWSETGERPDMKALGQQCREYYELNAYPYRDGKRRMPDGAVVTRESAAVYACASFAFGDAEEAVYQTAHAQGLDGFYFAREKGFDVKQAASYQVTRKNRISLGLLLDLAKRVNPS